jgi:hypothetical protein
MRGEATHIEVPFQRMNSIWLMPAERIGSSSCRSADIKRAPRRRANAKAQQSARETLRCEALRPPTSFQNAASKSVSSSIPTASRSEIAASAACCSRL